LSIDALLLVYTPYLGTAEILRCYENPCAEGTLECGGLTPHSKALRAITNLLPVVSSATT
jgi:hypothetical protein